jgi:hypothetical protein
LAYARNNKTTQSKQRHKMRKFAKSCRPGLKKRNLRSCMKTVFPEEDFRLAKRFLTRKALSKPILQSPHFQQPQLWSQSYDRELQRQRCKKTYNATGSQVCFGNFSSSTLKKRSSLPYTTQAL